MTPASRSVAIAVVGAGAAGLMAGIHAARTIGGRGDDRTVAVLDGARRPGAKILVSGGGRCNVTNVAVDERDFRGSTPAAIRKVLRRFDVGRTREFFEAIGVGLVAEPTGKLFPAGNRARIVLDALLGALTAAGGELLHPRRVETIDRAEGGFTLSGPWGRLEARTVILATGGMSVPRTGSDGWGLTIARSLGHTTTPEIVPALVPLTLEEGSALRHLSGVSADAVLTVVSDTGRRLAEASGAVLCTHFGLSGPAVLDVSRHWILARVADPGAGLRINWLPGETEATLDSRLRGLGSASVGALLSGRLAGRLAETLCRLAGCDPATPGHRLARDQRLRLSREVTAMRLPVTGNRGFDHAEVTAGGVPLSEVRLDTMESRRCPGLHLCGEILDVDGRIGGFNFQWAWSSGYAAGVGAAS